MTTSLNKLTHVGVATCTAILLGGYACYPSTDVRLDAPGFAEEICSNESFEILGKVDVEGAYNATVVVELFEHASGDSVVQLLRAEPTADGRYNKKVREVIGSNELNVDSVYTVGLSVINSENVSLPLSRNATFPESEYNEQVQNSQVWGREIRSFKIVSCGMSNSGDGGRLF